MLTSSFSPQDLCFLFPLYKDIELANRLLKQIKTFYPDSQIIAIADGVEYQEFSLWENQLNCFVFRGDRIKLKKYGGAYVERIFKVFLTNSKSKYLIYLEPDAYINRPFTFIPSCDAAGSIVNIKSSIEYPYSKLLMGGSTFFTRLACEKIIDSELLKNHKYKEHPYLYRRFAIPNLRQNETFEDEWIVIFDKIFSDIIFSLDLLVEEWTEVYSRCKEQCSNPQDYAVVHPVKNINK